MDPGLTKAFPAKISKCHRQVHMYGSKITECFYCIRMESVKCEV